MSEIEGSEPAPRSRQPAEARSEVAAAGRHRPRSLIEDHRECWRRGERLPVEDYLARFRPSGVDAADLLDLIYNEVVLREEDGESPQLEEYLKRFPLHDEALRTQFELHQFLQTSGELGDRPSPTSFDSSESSAGAMAEEFATFAIHTTNEPDASSRSAPRAGSGTGAPRILRKTRLTRPTRAGRASKASTFWACWAAAAWALCTARLTASRVTRSHSRPSTASARARS